MKLSAGFDLVNLVGSIASITGISVLWLNGVAPATNWITAVPIIAIATSFGIGVLALDVYLMMRVVTEVRKVSPSAAAQVSLICFALALLLFATFIVFDFAYLYFFVMFRDRANALP